MKVIAGIVCFQPQAAVLKRCLERIVDKVDLTVIIDNGSVNVSDIIEICGLYSNAVLIQNGSNAGMASALNQIFQYGCDLGYDYVLCLDQDSEVPENIIQDYERLLNEQHDFNQIGIVCPRIHDRMSNRTWPVVENDADWVMTERCITSGSLNAISVWKELGGFDEYLFIDEVDHDYSFRVVQKGYKILLCPKIVLEHQIGNTVVKQLFGKQIYIRNHSAFRKYYMVRNMIYLGRKHYGRVRFQDLGHAMLFWMKTLIYESDRYEKTKACMKGICDGCKHPIS